MKRGMGSEKGDACSGFGLGFMDDEGDRRNGWGGCGNGSGRESGGAGGGCGGAANVDDELLRRAVIEFKQRVSWL